jgi:hypothetical protein
MKNFTRTIIPELIIPEHIESVFSNVTCDLCGKEIKRKNVNHIDKAEIYCEECFVYPEGGVCTKTEFDICVKCFKDEVVSWFISRGAQPRVKEIDW